MPRHFTSTTFAILALLAAAAQAQPTDAVHPWGPESQETLAERFPAPTGTTRLDIPEGGFGAWLRALPVKPDGSAVYYFNGARKPKDVHVAVVDLDIGARDLQQCADAVMRLRAEYLLAAGCSDEIAFNFTSGDRAAWTAWSSGERPRIQGNDVSWSKRAEADDSYGNFRRYLTTVFSYAGSASLERELEKVDRPSRLEPGDIFIQGGFPGHAVIVMDVAEDAAGRRHFLLAQSYMPAQSLHVLKRPGHRSPWYPAGDSGPLATPEWSFIFGDLKRFPAAACERAEHVP